jgi:Tfp pilus assembly protein PilN
VKPVNLIPQDQRRRRPSEGSGNGANIVLGVLGVLLAMVIGYVMTANTVTERQSDAAAARAEADQLEARAAQQTTYTNFAQIALTRTQSVAGVAATRFDWERFMRELSRVMPEGSWLQTADASVLGDPTSGAVTATSTTPTATAAPAANLVGCTPQQSDVARLMVRVGQLHRVSDVELNESAAGAKEDTAGPDSCGALYTFNLTVEFSPAGPSTEAPRGSDRVPASLGGGS